MKSAIIFCMLKPFLKWAGGKRQLLPEIRKFYPEKIERYCEPFVGGGAVLFDVIERFSPREILINDINSELTNCYGQIRDNVCDLISILKAWQSECQNSSEERRKELYYERRSEFNQLILNSGVPVASDGRAFRGSIPPVGRNGFAAPTIPNVLKKAALMIYLNKRIQISSDFEKQIGENCNEFATKHKD